VFCLSFAILLKLLSTSSGGLLVHHFVKMSTSDSGWIGESVSVNPLPAQGSAAVAFTQDQNAWKNQAAINDSVRADIQRLEKLVDQINLTLAEHRNLTQQSAWPKQALEDVTRRIVSLRDRIEEITRSAFGNFSFLAKNTWNRIPNTNSIYDAISLAMKKALFETGRLVVVLFILFTVYRFINMLTGGNKPDQFATKKSTGLSWGIYE